MTFWGSRAQAGVAALSTCLGIVAPAFSQPPSPPNATRQISRVTALDPRWTLALGAPPSAAPGFDEQHVYIPLAADDLVALSLDTGRVVWRARQTATSAPATGDGMVFVSAGATVTALEQHTGTSLWRTELEWDVDRPLYWEGDWLLASSASGELAAIAARDGRVRWKASIGSPPAVAPAVFGERVFLALADHRLVSLAADTGEMLWTVDLGSAITGLLALDDQVLAGTRGNLLHSLSPARGRQRWSQKTGADIAGAAVADEQHIYFVAFDNVLRALGRRNGNLAWRRNLPARPAGGPLQLDSLILVPSTTQDIGAFQATTGAEAFVVRAAGEIGATPYLRELALPTAARLVTVSREGTLQVFAPRFEPAPAPLDELPGTRVGGD